MSTRRLGTGDPADDETDLDPTGMRALLGALPDPGPMPADLTARITARLAAEVSPAALMSEASARAHGHGVVDLAARRHRRRRTFGLVAASATVIGLGGTAMVTGAGPADLRAALGGSSVSGGGSSSQANSAGSAAEDASSLRAASEGGLAGVAPAADAQFVFTNAAWTPANLAASAATLLPPPAEDLLPSMAAEAPSIGPIMTPVGAGACAAALGLDPASVLVVDLGTWKARPAALLVVRTGPTGAGPTGAAPTGASGDASAGATQRDAAAAYVVDRYCSADGADLLAGPVPLP